MGIKIVQLDKLPPMDSGATQPGLLADEHKLIAVFRRAVDGDYAAVIFEGLISYQFGGPNDEGLTDHRFYKYGLKHYDFNQIENSPEADEYRKLSPTLWVVTFHDQCLEVLAKSVRTLEERIAVDDAMSALKELVQTI